MHHPFFDLRRKQTPFNESKKEKGLRRKKKENLKGGAIRLPPFPWSSRGCGEKSRKKFADEKTFLYLCSVKSELVMEIDVEYLPEASEFMLAIDKAAARKLAYNVGKVCMGIKDKEIIMTTTNKQIAI